MLPRDFWEHELADVIDYVEGYEEGRCREAYFTSVLISRFVVMQIGSMISKTQHNIPTYEELFETKPKAKTLDDRVNEIIRKFGGKVHGS